MDELEFPAQHLGNNNSKSIPRSHTVALGQQLKPIRGRTESWSKLTRATEVSTKWQNTTKYQNSVDDETGEGGDAEDGAKTWPPGTFRRDETPLIVSSPRMDGNHEAEGLP